MNTAIQRATRGRASRRSRPREGMRRMPTRGGHARRARRGGKQSGIGGLISQVTSRMSSQGRRRGGRSRKGMAGALAGMGAVALAGRRLLRGRGHEHPSPEQQ